MAAAAAAVITAPQGGILTAAQLAAPLGAWYKAAQQLIRNQNIDAKAWCIYILKELGIVMVQCTAPFELHASIQHLLCTYELPKDLQLRTGIRAGYTFAVSEESDAEVELEIVGVEEYGKPQRLQLQLHGSISGAAPNRHSKTFKDAQALQQLERLQGPCNVLLASCLLWLFRGEDVNLTQRNAWDVLRDVRPDIAPAAATPSSSQGSG
jgi:hypothetical protein